MNVRYNRLANATNSRRFSVPWDLTEWIDRSRLLQLINEDIDSLDWNHPALQKMLQANPAFRPRLLLVLMTYAFSMGICESEDVLELSYRDQDFARRFPDPPASAAAITRFRRDNRGLLRWAINQAMKHALRAHFNLQDTPLKPGVKRVLMDAAGTRLDVSRQLDPSVQGE